MKKQILIFAAVGCLSLCPLTSYILHGQNIGINTNQSVAFSQADRDMLIEMKTILAQHDKRFEELRSDMKWQFGILISAMFILVGFILWDRRTFIKPVEAKMKEVEKEIEELKKLKVVIKEQAKTDVNLAELLRRAAIF